MVVVNQIASNQMKVELVGHTTTRSTPSTKSSSSFFSKNNRIGFWGSVDKRVLSQIKQVLVLTVFVLVYSNVDRGTRGNTTMLVMTMVYRYSLEAAVEAVGSRG